MSWTQAGVEVFGEKLLWTDLAGNACALSTVWLAIRKTIWTWPVQLAGSVLLFTASVSAHFTGNALKQVMFGVLAVYGWAKWSQGLRDGHDLPIRPATGAERAVLVAVLAAGTGAVALLFARLPFLHAGWMPLANAYIFVGSAVATYAQSRALMDFWWIWVAVDLVGVPLAVHSELWVTGGVYVFFFVLVMIGFRDWLREYRAQIVRNPPSEAVAT
ncbi:nicotinamide mononucleotide transporter family protein [Actinomadura scrupuli]|uniref:nicotinamide mononucleotide transporter family protein n=1 Tax=Actinomadura scrupuli TaxID=559629 RepID=UPI003D97CA50